MSERFIGSKSVCTVSPGVGGMVAVTGGTGLRDVFWSQLTLGESSCLPGPPLTGPLSAGPPLASPELASPAPASLAPASPAMASPALEERSRWGGEPGHPVLALSGHWA